MGCPPFLDGGVYAKADLKQQGGTEHFPSWENGALQPKYFAPNEFSLH